MAKYIFVTGGVVSGLGKGIAAASLGRLLKARGLGVALQKFDPYLNLDPGTMNPYQHGEVFVTEDGAETDLDLGHYERFTDEDLTVDSSFPLGAAVSAILTVNGVNPGLTLLAAIAAGAGAGLITGLIHVKCKVRDLLSGIITMTALYSVNLRIAGKANVPLFAYDTLFKNDFTKALPEWIVPYATLILILLIALVSKLLLDLFLKTKAGYLLRAAGDNAAVVTTLARDQGGVKIIGLMIANALVSLAGAVLCQQQRFFDISMGTGTMVIGLASVIIGTNLFKRASFIKSTTAVLIGSILYKACVSIALSLGLDSQDMKLVTAALFLLILVAGSVRRKKVRIHA